MKIDITSIVIEKSSQSHIRFALKKATGEYVDYATFFCINKDEWELVKQCMLGTSKVYPYFDDGSYGIKFYPDGMRVMYSDKKDMAYFTWPTVECIPYVEQLWNINVDEHHYPEEPVCRFVDLTSMIDTWSDIYGPKIDLFIDDEVRTKLLQDEQSPLLSEPVRSGGLIAGLTRWAENYSSGNHVHVNIVFDSYKNDPCSPSDYYWWICTPDSKRIVNGGWIAHRYDMSDGNKTYRYSMHT